MSLFLEMLIIMIATGLIGTALGWLLHGKCDHRAYHDSDKRSQS